jgi:hypothetical protein
MNARYSFSSAIDDLHGEEPAMEAAACMSTHMSQKKKLNGDPGDPKPKPDAPPEKPSLPPRREDVPPGPGFVPEEPMAPPPGQPKPPAPEPPAPLIWGEDCLA